MKCEVRRARMNDSKALANITVESWRSAYSNIVPKDEIVKYLVGKLNIKFIYLFGSFAERWQ